MDGFFLLSISLGQTAQNAISESKSKSRYSPGQFQIFLKTDLEKAEVSTVTGIWYLQLSIRITKESYC